MVKRIFNKKASRGMAVLMAAAMVGTMSPVSLPTQPTWTVQAAAATETVATDAAKVKVTVKYAEETLSITDSSSGANTFYYAIATVKEFDATNAKKYPKASAYEEVSKDDMEDIDLSWANLTKDNTYLFVTTDTDVTKVKPVVTELAKQNTKLKISFSGTATDEEIGGYTAVGDVDNGYLKLDTDIKTNPDGIKFNKMEYRTENASKWIDVTDGSNGLSKKLKRYTAKGVTLQLRVKAVNPNDDGTVGNPAGKIFKVKVAAKAKAPKVTVNYLDQTVKFAKGTEYKIGNASMWTPVDDADANKAKSINSTGIGYTGSALTISVRTKANEKKAPSKTTTVTLPASISAPTATVATKDTVKPNETVGQISIDYVVPYNVDKGIQVSNYSTQPLQFAVIKKIDVTTAGSDVEQGKVDQLGIADKNKIKWTSVAAATMDGENVKKAGVGKVTKIDNKAISDVTASEYVIIYRVADKKATDISKIAVKALPVKLEQKIVVKKGESATLTDGAKDSLQEVTAGGDGIDLNVTFATIVDTKSTYKVTAYKAKLESDKYVKDSDTKTSDVKGSVADGKLTITATAKAQGNYILVVSCESATFTVPVHVFKSTTSTITADNTVSAVTSADDTKVTAAIGKDKKSVVVTSKAKATDGVIVTLTVAAPTEENANATKTVKKKVTVDADGNITVTDA